MTQERPADTAAEAARDKFDFRGANVTVNGPAQFGGGAALPPERKPVSTVPTPSLTFVPRKALTAKIHAALTANPGEVVVRQAVTRAMGGYGKTVAAILYAHQYQSEYLGGRFFLPMESGDLVTGLASLVTALGLEGTNNPAADAASAAQALRNGPPSLLILDNLASKAVWDGMLASGLIPRGACRLLITTRDEEIDKAGAIAVGRLEPAEAREVFRLFCTDRRGREKDPTKRAALPQALPDDAIADAITDWLGGLAVSIAAVAAYMRLKPHLSWEVYWNGDGGKARGLRNTPLAELPEIRPEVAAQLGIEGAALEAHRRTVRVIDDALSALPAPERRAVEYAALLPHNLAPAAWLEALLDQDAARPHPSKDSSAFGVDGGGDPLHLDLPDDPDDPTPPAVAVLNHLDALDILLPGGESGKLLSLHHLWYLRVNELAPNRPEDRSTFLLAIAAYAATRREVIIGTTPDGADRTTSNAAAITNPSLRWEITPLAETCKMLWAANYPGPAVRIGVWLATVLHDLGRLKEAAACLLLSHENDDAVEAALGPNDPGSGYSNLSAIQQALGNLSGARQSIEKAIAIDVRHHPSDHPLFVIRYANLATVQHAQGDLKGAATSIKRAIATQPARVHLGSPQLAGSYCTIAMIQRDLGDLSGAMANINLAVEWASTHLETDHPTLGFYLSHLALIQRDRRDFSTALVNIQRSIDIHAKHYDPGHPEFATRYTNLALIQQSLRRLPEAFTSMRRAIEIDEIHFDPNHPNMAINCINLAGIYFEMGNRVEACANFKKALAILLKHFGEDHPHVKIVRASMKAAGCAE